MFNPEHARPIVAESIDQHAKELRKRLQIIQLSFADSKFLEEKEKKGVIYSNKKRKNKLYFFNKLLDIVK